MGARHLVAKGSGPLLWPLQGLQTARGTLFGWVPVLLGLGIGGWFALPWEPGAGFYLAALAVLALAAALRLWGPELLHPVAVSVACLAAGPLACGLRLHLVAAPVLEASYWGPVQGRVIEIDRSQSDALRLTLDHVVLEDLPPERTPLRIRISVHGTEPQVLPGEVVLLSATLSAPAAPVEPGGFDFQRMAYFDGLGAAGYTRSPVVLWAEPEAGEQVINRLRSHLSRAIMVTLPGDAGAFASGAMTGDRSGISRDTVEALRDSNLSHLLAISGMNMAFLTGFVFLLIRTGVALIPPLALRINAKKAAAVVAFGVALFYLLLSGANVATERAFLMVSVMLGAVLLDRRALTLRSVALAGTVLLLWQPESLLEPGFQLSFAATTVLIAGFGVLDHGIARQKLPRWLLPVYMLVLSSVLAGLATAPFAAAHFNRFTDYGLVANLLTVPVMSVLMGAGAVAALLAPLGLATPALWVMELAARWILFVAHWIAGLDGSVAAVPTPGPWVLPLITLAGVWAMLWRGRLRLLAALPLLAGLALWAVVERPVLLIAEDGKLVGVMGPDGRALSRGRGGGFAAESWLENDGDLATQAEAARRPGIFGPKEARRFALAGIDAVVLSGEGAVAELARLCPAGGLIVLDGTAPLHATGPCRVIDHALLAQTGALAGQMRAGALWLIPTRNGRRAWTGQTPLRAPICVSNCGSGRQAGPAP
ncbi:ComEC/Rec2 family competence protein [Tabrizicola fusiformis]|uniref:ComEC/Rec2 family competence protein n=1 Tax=Tabrizicola sp. SY72 TaxID=2741673 RepID=UPI001574C818|nr:ComEC/Rec2 family competence protein [Tabrizicola sp. SY72]NTT85449.1 ComEC/Rec2 family competence protein [Tabrizicola sp. SY72]